VNLQALLDQLTHPDTRRRDLAAAELGDLLRTGALNQADTEQTVTRLVTTALHDADPTVRESALHAIDEAFNHRTLPLRLFDDLQRQLTTLEPALLDYALNILACTHDPAARPAIEAFLNHPDPNVRTYTAEALIELPGRQT
jgi:HEAT repeat protein